MEIYEKIRYYREHTDFSQRNVAKILGISRNTVKKYWEGRTVPWERKPGSGRKNDIITDDVKAFIMKCLDSDQKAPRKQQHTAHKIYTRLVAECGFDGCEASVRRTVAELKGKVSNVFVPLSYDPAEAVQVDWGEATVILGGIKQKIQIWCMRECHSGDIFVSAFYRQNEESFLEGIVKGLEHFGGTPQKRPCEKISGTLKKYQYYSTTRERNVNVNVLLPADYNENETYPVLYALHGYWETEDSLAAMSSARTMLGNLNANGEAEKMIVVFPYGNL